MNHPELDRLAFRVEGLVRTRTHGWDSGDELEFRQSLPMGHDRRKLPDPAWLKTQARARASGTDPMGSEWVRITADDYRIWLNTALRLEGLVRDNDSRNPKRMMRDMARGKSPF